MAAFAQDPITLTFGSGDGAVSVEIREMPMPRVKRFKNVIGGMVEDYHQFMSDFADAQESGKPLSDSEKLMDLSDIILSRPHEILSIIIPGLPEEPFLDEENGVTFPQLVDAFDKVLTVNRLEWLKNSLPFFRDLILTIDPTDLGSRLSFPRTGTTPAYSPEPASGQ